MELCQYADDITGFLADFHYAKKFLHVGLLLFNVSIPRLLTCLCISQIQNF